METIQVTINEKRITYISSCDIANAGEHLSSEIVFTFESAEWASLIKQLVIITPLNEKLLPLSIVSDRVVIPAIALRTPGYLYFSVEGIRIENNLITYQQNTGLTRLAVRKGVTGLTEIEIPNYTNIISDIYTATGDALSATSASLAQTGLCEAATGAAVEIVGAVQGSYEEAEAVRDGAFDLAETGRQSAENVRTSSENARNVFVAYNALTAYVIGNKVTYLGSSYRCILASTGNLPTNGTYWMLIASKGDAGSTMTTASQMPIVDAGGYFGIDNVEAALQESATKRLLYGNDEQIESTKSLTSTKGFIKLTNNNSNPNLWSKSGIYIINKGVGIRIENNAGNASADNAISIYNSLGSLAAGILIKNYASNVGMHIANYAVPGTQSYGLDLKAYPGGDSAFAVHNYSDASLAGVQLDNCWTKPMIIMRTAYNPTNAPGSTGGTGDFIQFLEAIQTAPRGVIGAITKNADFKFMSTNGPVLKDRTTSTYYRLKVDNGVLGMEAV